VILPIRFPSRGETTEEPAVAAAGTPITIPDVVNECCSRFGPRVAYRMKVGNEFRRLTFTELRRQAMDFGAGLIALGLRQGDRVAIICENGFEWVIAYHGQSIAGGVGVPLYTELKRPEIDEMVQRCGARFIVASARVLSKIREDIPGVVKVIGVGDEVEAKPGVPAGLLRRAHADLIPFQDVAAAATEESRRALAETRVAPDDLASIVFTSGTTGGMKGVMLTHRNFMSNVDQIRRTLALGERDRLLLVLPLHHAYLFTAAVLALVALGAEVVFENDLLRVRERLAEVRPTLFLGVPALYEVMYRAIEGRAEAEGRKKEFERSLRIAKRVKDSTRVNIGRQLFAQIHRQLGGKLRLMLSGGAALSPELALKYFRLGLPLLQGWGLTEAAPVAAAQRWSPYKFRFTNYYEQQVGSVGAPVPEVEVKLIDVPEKEIYVHLHGEGELVIRGPNVSPGYWNAEEATREARVGEWFRSGDLGRIDEEGNIWITGRSKYVIVLDSGEKVVPDELEERLIESALIEDICVVPRQMRNKTVVGAVIYPNLEATRARCEAENMPLDESSVRTLLASEMEQFAADLAPFKRVSEIILTDTPLPKTALQKVARGQLRDSHSFDLKRWGRNKLATNNSAGEESEETGPAEP